MKMENEFTVDVPVDEAWDVMLDLERVAPCLPGASLQEKQGDEYKGTMTVKIGPITASYKGTVEVEEADEEARRAVLQASGKDARGQGTASATIVSTLQEEGEKTKVSVETDMKLTGRAAQFGRGIQQDVAAKLLQQFAGCLEKEILGEGGGEEEEPEEAAVSGGTDEAEQPRRRIIQQEEVEPLDLGAASYEAILKRVVPLAAGVAVLAIIIWLIRR